MSYVILGYFLIALVSTFYVGFISKEDLMEANNAPI